MSRNGLFGSNMIAVTSVGHHIELAKLTEVISIEQCTLLGRLSLLNGGRTQDKLACSDNLVIAPDNPVIAYSPDLYSQMQIEGSRNAYWQTTDHCRDIVTLLPAA